VQPPGTDAHPGGDPLLLPLYGSVTHEDFITCETTADGEHHVIATARAHFLGDPEWTVHETIFTFDSSANSSEDGVANTFRIVSNQETTVPYDPDGEAPEPAGKECWTEANPV
jgi:hypothetical protein